jgi:hypothetical protein
MVENIKPAAAVVHHYQFGRIEAKIIPIDVEVVKIRVSLICSRSSRWSLRRNVGAGTSAVKTYRYRRGQAQLSES